jgi:hypothetical protein
LLKIRVARPSYHYVIRVPGFVRAGRGINSRTGKGFCVQKDKIGCVNRRFVCLDKFLPALPCPGIERRGVLLVWIYHWRGMRGFLGTSTSVTVSSR